MRYSALGAMDLRSIDIVRSSRGLGTASRPAIFIRLLYASLLP